MLKSLRAALAQYAIGAKMIPKTATRSPAPIEDLVLSLVQSIKAAEDHLMGLGFDPMRLIGAKGFPRIQALRDGVDALLTSDESKRRYEIMARQIFLRFRTLLMEPSVFQYAERHDNIEAIYKKLEEKRDLADVTDVLKELHKIVNEAIRTQDTGVDHAEGLMVDLSQIDFAKLRDEFASKVKRKHAAFARHSRRCREEAPANAGVNPPCMDYYKRYQEIIADYNREKDRVTVEQTFAELAELATSSMPNKCGLLKKA